ncbi:MAG: DUF523 domain-containing protein [Epsilonproteobacteria bacterium]|nr:DUF523 domain-containing protein [Campylobacterota bacterium]
MKVAISACLMGCPCRYDATDNLDTSLLEKLSSAELIPFCPEDNAFGSPRPTMDLVDSGEEIAAISNLNGENLSNDITVYAQRFFEEHRDINLFIGKDRSPSCGVCSAKIYDGSKRLISTEGTGLMAKEALLRHIESYDSEVYMGIEK